MGHYDQPSDAEVAERRLQRIAALEAENKRLDDALAERVAEGLGLIASDEVGREINREQARDLNALSRKNRGLEAENERLLEALGDGWVVQRAGPMFEAIRAPAVVGGDTERLSETSLARLLLGVHLRIRERHGGPCIATEALRDDD